MVALGETVTEIVADAEGSQKDEEPKIQAHTPCLGHPRNLE